MNVIFFLYLGIISHLTFKWKIQVHINHTHPLKFIRCCNILLSLFVGTLCFRFFHAAENFLEYAITNNRLFQTTFQILLILTSIESKYKTHYLLGLLYSNHYQRFILFIDTSYLLCKKIDWVFSTSK